MENPFLRGALPFQTITSFFEDKPVLDFIVILTPFIYATVANALRRQPF